MTWPELRNKTSQVNKTPWRTQKPMSGGGHGCRHVSVTGQGCPAQTCAGVAFGQRSWLQGDPRSRVAPFSLTWGEKMNMNGEIRWEMVITLRPLEGRPLPWTLSDVTFIILFFFFSVFFLFRATRMAYGGSQARGQTGAGSSQMLVRFVSTGPGWELLCCS